MAEQVPFSSLAVLDALPAHIALLDEAGTIVAVNKAWRRFAEANHFRDLRAGVGTNYIALCESVHGDGAAETMAVAQGIREVMTHQRDEFSLEYACDSPDEQRWFILYVSRFEGAGPVRLVVSHENITKRKVVEEKIRESEEHYRFLFENTLAGIFRSAPEKGFTHVNPALVRMLGYNSADEVLALKLPDDVYVDPAQWERLRAQYEATGVADGVELLWKKKSGEPMIVSLYARTVRDAQGQVSSYGGVVLDVTIGKNTEVQLRNLINTTQDAVVSIDRQGRIDLFNPAAEHIFGYTQAEIQGQRVELLMPEPYASEHNSYVTRYEQTGEVRAIGRVRTIAARRKNGEIFPMELSVTEIKAGGEIRYGAFIRDISEKIRLQERLVERERLAAIGTTAATFAHEVGNPLNSMYMAAQLLERYCTKQKDLIDEKAILTLQNLMSEIRRLTVLLEDFRSLARRQQLNLQPTPLATLVADLLTVEMPSYAARSIRIRQEVPHDLPLIAADREKLRQVLLNLCKNAVEAMPQGGTLTVRASHSGDLVRLEISDTGVGIPPGVNVFEPFITTKAQGTGLGLTIVRQIVSAHGGTLTHHSEPGQGTTFILELQISQN